MLKKLFKQPKKNILPIINLVLIILVIMGGVFYLVKNRKEPLININQQLAQLNQQFNDLRRGKIKDIGEQVSDLREEVKDLKKQVDEIDIRTDYVIDPETGWKIYQDKENQFEIRYPSDFFFEFFDQEKKIMITSFNTEMEEVWRKDEVLGIFIFTRIDNNISSLEDLRKYIEADGFYRDVVIGSDIKLEEESFNDFPALQFELKSERETSRYIWFLVDGKPFHIIYRLTGAKYKDIGQEILDSFRMIK